MFCAIRDPLKAGEHIRSRIGISVGSLLFKATHTSREQAQSKHLNVGELRGGLLYAVIGLLEDVFWMVLIKIKDVIALSRKRNILEGVSNALKELFICRFSCLLEGFLSRHCLLFLSQLVHHSPFDLIVRD